MFAFPSWADDVVDQDMLEVFFAVVFPEPRDCFPGEGYFGCFQLLVFWDTFDVEVETKFVVGESYVYGAF